MVKPIPQRMVKWCGSLGAHSFTGSFIEFFFEGVPRWRWKSWTRPHRKDIGSMFYKFGYRQDALLLPNWKMTWAIRLLWNQCTFRQLGVEKTDFCYMADFFWVVHRSVTKNIQNIPELSTDSIVEDWYRFREVFWFHVLYQRNGPFFISFLQSLLLLDDR